MHTKLLLLFVTIVTSLFCPGKLLAQAPVLGTAANFVLFTSNGAVTNSGVSNYTGNIGARIGTITGFGNVNGQIHALDAEANQAATDLLTAYGQLHAAVPDSTLPAIIGNGDTLGKGTYLIPQP
ncbi:MAG: ice-binding family protein, partial [Bacteroidota bacterium]